MKIVYGNRACEFTFAEDLVLPAGYPEDTVRYALQRFFRRDDRLRYDCTLRSLQCRFASGRGKQQTVRYEIPAEQMELPRGRGLVRVKIDPEGVEVQNFRICREREEEKDRKRIIVFSGRRRKKGGEK